ncbi:MobF family relaxase [Thermodesulfovibrio sp. 1176]|uniref:MobF family relaxase n=1 Tax=Thermodesulfovibrio sp. 1176 TaxID=3043424 RepID=UPI002482C7E8|nr:MobF family relaxase [Thermodesulfovibrio sp. 1176]MDI1471541.1 MobF family relaxase [Thermodesulfovibrio sp. 1176]
MISFGQIYQSLEQYDRDNYYVKDSEVETRFQLGSGWKELNAKEGYEITSEDFKKLAHGKDLNGNYLSKEFEQKDHRQGFDFVWSPHKSITLYAFTSKENLQTVTNSMNEATKNLVNFLEKEGYIQYRETVNGKTISKSSDNATVLVNTHLCGRLDPQIHNHISFFNFTKTENGDWKALNSDALYSNKYMIEAYLENQLAYQLKQQGINTELVKEGNSKEYVTKIAGLNEEHWKGIARTSELIDKYLEQHREELLQKYQNASESQLREYAYLEIRQSKQSKTVEELFKQVEDALKEQGLSKQDIIDIVTTQKEILEQEKVQGLEQKSKEEIAKEIVNKAIDEIIDRHSTFSQSDLYKAAFQISAGRVDSDTLVQTVKENERIIEMGCMQDKQHNRANATYQEKYFTSQEVIAWEYNILKSVEQGKGSVEKITEQKYENEKLTKSQLEAINHILQSTDRYTAVVGWAGVGKTTFVGEMSKELGKINEIAKEAGYRLIGVSNTNTAVNELKEVGIEAMTTAKFLNSAKALQNLDSKTILIVDEASFLSTKDMSTILDKTRESGCRIVFIGDDRQLPGVQAGSPFAALIRENKINHVKMTDIVRQRNEELKSAVYDIYHKNIESALNKITFKTIERDSALEIATHALKSDKPINIVDREIFEKVKEMFEGQGSATQYVQQFKSAPFEREIIEKLGIEDAGQREAFFFYKDFGFHEGENPHGIKEDQAKKSIRQMIKMGWVVATEVEVNGKKCGAYQKTGLFGVDPSRIREVLGEKYEEYQKQIEQQQKEILREIAKEYISQGYKNSAISVATNQDAKILNSLISEELRNGELKGAKSIEVNVWVNKNLDNVERLKASSYNVGDKLLVMSSGSGVSVGKELFVKEVDIVKNTLKVEYTTKKGEVKERVFNIEKLGDKVQAFQRESITIVEGEKLIFNNTYKDKNFANSEFAYIKSINEDGSITVVNKLDSDKAKITTFTKEELEKGVHFQHGYAVTADRMQGKTTQNVIAFETRSHENFLVSITRAKQNATIYSTMSKEKFIERASEEATKERIEKMAYRFNDEVFNAVKDQVYENFQQQEKQQEQDAGQGKEEFKGFEKEREGMQGFQYEKQNERYKESVFFASEALKNYEREQYKEWAKHFSEKDFKAVQKPQKPNIVKKIANAMVDSNYVDRKFKDWLNGKTRDKFEKWTLKDQIKTWWKNNLNRDLEKLTGQKRRDYWKTYEVYTKDQNGQWHKGIQKLHVKVRGSKTITEGYTLTKDGISYFRIEKQKGLFGIEREIDREIKFITHEQIKHEQKQEKEVEQIKKTYSNEASARAKEIVKHQQERQEKQQEKQNKKQEKVDEKKVERNEKDEVKKFVIQTIGKQGKITNKEVLRWAKQNKIKTENAISAMKELNFAGKIYSDKYDKKTKTITFISTTKLSEQRRAVEQAIMNIYKNTAKEHITIKDIKKELEKEKIEISSKTLKKHIETCICKANEEGKYNLNNTLMAIQDRQIVKIYVNSTKSAFTSKELGENMKKNGHEINERRLEKYIQEQDVRIIGFQKNQDGKIEAVYSNKDRFKENKQEWLKKEGSIRQKADEQLVKAVIEKTKGSGLSKEEIDKKIQEATNSKHKGYTKSLRERVQTQEKMKTQERAQTQELSRSTVAAEQSQSLRRGR